MTPKRPIITNPNAELVALVHDDPENFAVVREVPIIAWLVNTETGENMPVVPFRGWEVDASVLDRRTGLVVCGNCGSLHPSKEDYLFHAGANDAAPH